MADPIIIARQFKNSGANWHMQNLIRQYYESGKTVEDAAIGLNIDPNCVQSFYDKYSGAKKGKVAAEPEKEDDWEAPAAPAPRKKAVRKKA